MLLDARRVTRATRKEASVTLTSNGVAIDTRSYYFGELESANDLLGNPAALHACVADRGYLLLRGLIDREAVLAAREEILFKYAIVGEIDAVNHPLMDAVQGGDSVIEKIDLFAFTESIRRGKAYTEVVLHPSLVGFFESFLDGPVTSYDFRWPRFVRPGEGCGFHCDGPYINRGTRNVWSAWVPLGDVTAEEGALLVLEGSHQSERLRRSYAERDADRDKLGWLSTDPIALQRNLGGRWLTTDFRAGDVMIFGLYLAHGALDNNSPARRCRLTSDTRYQLATDALDDRWNGPNHRHPHGGRRVFLPGLGRWNNKEFADEWKPVDDRGRLALR
jgi:hypothetical protein